MTDAGPSPAELYQEIVVPAIFVPLTRETLAATDLRPGLRALDLACGTGVVARALAGPLGPEGQITGVDLGPGMLTVARRQPLPDGAPIDWQEGDATALELHDAAFDLVVCQQGLQFFLDKPCALREMRRVLRPVGQLAIAVWCGLEEQSLMADLTAAEARHLAPLDISYEEIAKPFSMGDGEALEALVKDAGFGEITRRKAQITARFPSATRFVEDLERPYSAVIGEFAADPAAFARFLDAVQADIGPTLDRWRDGDGLAFPICTTILTARA